MAKIRRSIQLKIERGYLYFQRLRKNGEACAKPLCWEIQDESNIPRSLLHSMCRRIIRHTKVHSSEDFDALKEATIRGLRETGKMCGCRVRTYGRKWDVLWFLKGKPFFAFQIHHREIDKKRLSRLLRSKAVFRGIIRIKENGLPWYEPQETRPDARFDRA